MSESRGKTMIKHTGIYAIGSFGSRLISFLLVPIYTFLIPASEFGYYDLCFTIVLLTVPIVSLQLKEGTLRFLITASESQRAEIISLIFRRLILSSLALLLMAAVIHYFFAAKYIWYTAALAEALMLYDVVGLICRGLERNLSYSLGSLVSAFFVCVLSLCLIYFMKVGIEGVFIGNIIGRFIAVGYMLLKTRVLQKYLSLKLINRNLSKEITAYCVPTIITVTLQWVINSSNRFFIEYYCGVGQVGIFAVAMKWGQIFDVVAGIFLMSWQELAFTHYNDKDRNVFFSRIINALIWFFIVSVVLCSFGLNLVYPIIIGTDYQTSAAFVFLAIMSVAIGYVAIFYDVAYQCVKQTKRSAYGLIVASAVAIPAYYFFVQWWGIYGSYVAMILAFVVLLVYRIIDTKKYIELRWDKRTWLSIGFMGLSLVIYQLQLPWIWNLSYFAISVMVFAALMPGFAMQWISGFGTKLTSKFH